MKLNRKWMLVIALMLSIAVATGGTLAYLSDTDADVNTMTLGNVYIEQHEYERVMGSDGKYETVTSEQYGEGYKVQPFTQGKPLFPAVDSANDKGGAVYWDQLGAGASGGQKVLEQLSNVVDKFVLVENTGKSPAYVRTIIAYEVGSKTDAFGKLIMTSRGDFYTCNEVGVVKIDGNNYFLVEYVYAGNDTRHPGGVLPAGEYTCNSLAQIYLVSEATNEDIEALDGNNNGLYDVLVVSQAIQTAGFSDAKTALDAGFGPVSVDSHPWMDLDGIEDEDGDQEPDMYVVNNADEMFKALKAGIYDDIYGKALKLFIIETNEAIELDAKGTTVHLAGKFGEPGSDDFSYLGFVPPKGESVKLSNLSVTGSGFVEVAHHKEGNGNYTIDNLTISDLRATLAVNNCGFNIAAAFSHYGTATMTDCVMRGTISDVAGFKPYDAAFVNGTKTNIVGGTYGVIFLANQAHVTITDAEVDTIDSCAITTRDLGKLTIGAGAKVGTINLTPGTYPPALVIEDGATVDTITYNGVTYTQAEWMAR